MTIVRSGVNQDLFVECRMADDNFQDYQRAVHELDDGDEIEYRAISLWSIFAFVVGLISLTALMSPGLLFLGVVGILVSALSIRSVSQDDRPMVGKRLAWFGLGLAMFSVTYGVGTFATRRAAIYRDARTYAMEWFDMIREGRRDEAFQVRMPQEQRKSPSKSWDDYQEEMGDQKAQMAYFFEISPFKELDAYGQEGEVEFLGNVRMQPTGEDRAVIQKYRLRYKEGGQPKELEFQIGLRRHYNPAYNQCYWEWMDDVPMVDGKLPMPPMMEEASTE